jgi:hypothetical protein
MHSRELVSTVDADPRRSPRRRRAWRTLRAASVAIVSVYVLYIVGINVFLSTSLFDDVVNFDREMLDVRYRKGWSVFPGTIHARDLRIRASDNHVEWLLSLDTVEFDISLLSLAQRRFDVERAHGRGISLRARQKLDSWPESVDDIRYLPPIPGFPAFSVAPAGPPSLETWYDSHYALWTVHLEDVVAEDVREVWIDNGRFEGNARITGRFYLKPLRNVDVGPAHVDIRTGHVTLGRTLELAANVTGTSDVTIDRFDPRTVDANEGLLRHVTLGTELRGELADPATLPFVLAEGLYASTEIDVRRLALRLNRGVLAAGTHADLGTHHLVGTKGNVTGTGGFELSVDVAADARGDLLTADALLEDVSLTRTDTSQLARAPRVEAHAESRELELARAPFADARVQIRVPDADLADARVVDVYLPRKAPLEIMGGAAHASGHVELSLAERSATASGHLLANELDVRLAKMRTRGSFDVLASIADWRWGKGRIEHAKISAAVAKAKIASERAPAKPKINAEHLYIDASARDMDLADPLRSLEASFVMPAASIVDIQMLGGYLPKKKMQVLEGHSRFELDGRVAVDDHRARGRLRARSRHLGFELGDVRVEAAVEARAKVRDWRWEEGDLALDNATVDLTDIAISRADAPDVLASIDRLSIGLESPAFAFADPLARVDLRVDLAGGKVLDAAAIDAFLPDDATYGLASDGGTFDGKARLSFTDHVAHGRADSTAQRMGIRSARFEVHGSTRVAIDIERWDLKRDVISLGPSLLAIDDVRGRFGKDVGSDLTGKGFALTGRAHDLDIGHPALRAIDAHLVLAHAEIPNAHSLDELLPAGGAVKIESGRARASADVRISSSAKKGSGVFALDIEGGAVAVHETQLAGDFGLRATVRGFDPATSTVDLSGSRLTMREVVVKGAAAETDHWSGDIALQQGSLRLRPLDDAPMSATDDAPAFDTVAHLVADDARPLLGVLLRDSVPKLLIGIADMPRLEAYARVHLSPHALVISDVSARGGDIALRGTYALYDKDRRGAFIVHKGPFSFGLRLHPGGMTPRFFNLDAWFGAQERNVKAKTPPQTR